jgi:hypothetical protein
MSEPDIIVTFEVDEDGKTHSVLTHRRVHFDAYVGAVCPRCHDTGTIDTGNNDLPCDCAAGDSALFNVAVPGGARTMTGAEVKRGRY